VWRGLTGPYTEKDERAAGGGAIPDASGLCHQYVKLSVPNNKGSVRVDVGAVGDTGCVPAAGRPTDGVSTSTAAAGQPRM